MGRRQFEDLFVDNGYKAKLGRIIEDFTGSKGSEYVISDLTGITSDKDLRPYELFRHPWGKDGLVQYQVCWHDVNIVSEEWTTQSRCIQGEVPEHTALAGILESIVQVTHNHPNIIGDNDMEFEITLRCGNMDFMRNPMSEMETIVYTNGQDQDSESNLFFLIYAHMTENEKIDGIIAEISYERPTTHTSTQSTGVEAMATLVEKMKDVSVYPVTGYFIEWQELPSEEEEGSGEDGSDGDDNTDEINPDEQPLLVVDPDDDPTLYDPAPDASGSGTEDDASF